MFLKTKLTAGEIIALYPDIAFDLAFTTQVVATLAVKVAPTSKQLDPLTS